MASTVARAYLCFGVLAVVANAALGGSNILYESVGLSSAGLVLLGTALHRPAVWRPWVGIAISQLLFAIGDIAFSTGASSPSPVDAVYLSGDLLLILSMGWLVVAVGGRRDLGSLLDAALLALVVGVCGWDLLASSAMTTGSIGARIVAVGYPVADLVLLALLVRLLFVREARSPAFWLLLAGVVTLFLADAGYVIPATSDSYRPGGWLDAGWLFSYVAFGLAALQPSMGRLVRPRAAQGPSLPVRRALVLGVGLVAVPIAMVVHHALGAPVNALVNELALVAITAGVVLRGGLLVWELERLRHKAEQSERKFRLVFERAPIGITIGSKGMMSETNPALQQMLGYTGDEFAQMHYTDVTHPDDQDFKQQLELDAGTRDAFSIDKRYRRRDGSYIEAHVHVALDLDDGLGISLVEDVTGRHELEDQLRQSQKMESIGKLAGGIAHDFNNLMTAVMGYSDLLLRDAVGADRDKVDAIRDSAVRASDLTRQLLAFSRRQVLQTQEIDLRDVVERMDTLLKRLLGEDVRLRTLFGSTPVIVRADKTQLEQVVMNLAVNARDAMPDGGTLTVAVLTEGDTAVLSVRDDGIGMDEETLEQIFEPFFTTKSLAESSGLGLSTVHGIVGQSGGTVIVDSEPGRGTTFTVRLPVARAAVLPAEPVRATLVD
ncbi:MAG: two-component system, cell cycle sensor histidine kinase and response regulator CckA [Gaiellaceae bacterium]|nr:two-component system, cell cycle sensor histidine kinase and response regulator CckA [Gaiellaceae bacterium]